MKHLIASLLMLWALMAPLLGRGQDGSGAGCTEHLSCCAKRVPACHAACCQKAPDRLPAPAAPATPPSTSLSDLTAPPLLTVLWSLPEGSRTGPADHPDAEPASSLEGATPLFRRDCALLI